TRKSGSPKTRLPTRSLRRILCPRHDNAWWSSSASRQSPLSSPRFLSTPVHPPTSGPLVRQEIRSAGCRFMPALRSVHDPFHPGKVPCCCAPSAGFPLPAASRHFAELRRFVALLPVLRGPSPC